MKHLLKLSALLLALLVPAAALAHDFEVDGIYYKINGTTAAVTFKGSSFNQYSNEYTGNVTIPAAVTYNGKTYSVTTIGNYAFYGCTGLTSTTIPNPVTTIGEGAFSGCTSLTSITIPNSVSSIGYGTFSGCSGLTSITIPNSVTSIGEMAFSGCTSLTNVTIPNFVTTIGYGAFSGCTSLTSITIPNSVTIIGEWALSSCTSLTSITIPSTVTTIGNYAFSGCTSLTSATIPNSVTAIGSSALSNCPGLTSISVANGNPNYDSRNNCNAIIETSSNTLIAGCQNTIIPNSVTSIGERAFSGCSGLTSITIPNSVNTIGISAFSQCVGLQNVIIPNSVVLISDYAFHDCSSLVSIDIPDSVVSIGMAAFNGCNNLADVIIGNSVTSIGRLAFCGSRLRNITCHAVIPPILSDVIFDSTTLLYGKLYVPRMSLNSYIASDYWKNFKSINGLYDFTVDGFYYRLTDDNTVALTYKDLNYNSYAGDITIPSSVNYGGLHTVTSIDDRAFFNCNDLTSITIPNTIGSIGVSAFKNCNNLSSVDIQDSSSWPWFYKSIGDSAFCNCSNLTSIIIPEYVRTIGKSAFSDCTGLTNVTMRNFITTIGSSAFQGCTSLTGVHIPNSVTTIGSGAFSGCTGLTSITIPNSVTTIGDGAFSGCTDLTSVTLPIALRYISSYAFSDCSSLKDLTIPDDVTDIGYYAFSNCRSLTSVIIPDSVTYILDYSFKNCSNLTCVTMGESVAEIDQNVFQGCTALETLNFNAINLRYVAPNTFSNIATINFGDKVKRIPANFAYGDANITDLNLPNTITSIGRNAFFGTTWYDNQPNGLVYAGSFAYIYKGIMPENTSIVIRDGTVGIADGAFEWMDEDRFGLINVTLPNSMTYIGEFAFCDCGGLTSVIVPNSVTYIGESAFEGCWSLTSVTIPNSMTSLNENVFEGCTSLTNVTIPNSIRNIGYGAFSECPKLNEVYCDIDDLSNISMSNDVFELYDGGYESRTLYVPSGTLNAYQADTKWSSFFGSIVEIKDIFEMPDTSLLYWETVTIPIVLNNDHPILAFQTDIVLPEGFSIVADEEDEYLITPSSRLSNDHVMMASDYGSGVVRVVCYTPESYPVDGYTGDLFYITVKVPEDAAGEYPIILRNSRLTTEDYTELRIPDANATITVKTYIPGDANNSRSVTVTDIVVTAQYVLGRNPQPFTFDAADMNGDGDVTVTDIMLIAYMLQHPSVDAPQRVPALTANHDRMSADAISLMPGETRTVSIMLDNDRNYSAFQLDLTLPEGLTASNFALTDRAGGHAFDVSAIDDGKLRALCYSPALATISGHEGALLTFDVTAMDQVTGDIIVDAIELVTDACQTVNMGAFAILVNNASTANEVVSGKSVARVDYYNVAGQQIAEPTSGVTIIVTTYTDGTRSTTKLQR